MYETHVFQIPQQIKCPWIYYLYSDNHDLKYKAKDKNNPQGKGSPESNFCDQMMLAELLRQIANFLVDRPCKVFPAPFDLRLFYEEDESDN
jgi:hypothetical protein